MAAVIEGVLEKAAEAIASRAAMARGAAYVGTAGAAAGTASELTKKDDVASKAGAAPIAKAGTQADAKKNCKKCPPDAGQLWPANHSMKEVNRAYQARITGFAPNTEWRWLGLDWDGFQSSACLLLEAKSTYDQFFGDDGKPKYWFNFTGAADMIEQASEQSERIMENEPAQCHWHFMQPVSYAWFKEQASAVGLFLTVFYTP